jgi:hypothetical protein
MADKWIAQSGAGLADGSSFANRAPESSFASLESAMSAGDTMYISAVTITLSAVWTITGNSKRFVAVNSSTGSVDGSIATLDAANVRANCIEANARSYCQYKHIEFIRATGTGFQPGSFSLVYNCKARNNGSNGFYINQYSEAINLHSNNNTAAGINLASSGNVSFSQSISNGADGFAGGISFVTHSISHANTLSGFYGYHAIIKCVSDGNSNGVNNAGVYPSSIIGCSITNNTTGVTTNATATAWVTEKQNYFYNNTTKFGGTTSAIYSLGGSIDGSTDPYNNRAGDDFKPATTAEGLGTEYPFGMIAEANNISYGNMGLDKLAVDPITVTDIDPAEGSSGDTVTITGTNFTGSGNIVKLGGSGGTSCTITSQSTTEIEFTVPAIATAIYDVYIENSDGLFITVPNGFELVSDAVPVFAGITHFEILSANKFYVKCGTATNSPTTLNIYISDSASVFTGGYSFKVPYTGNREILVSFEEDHYSPLVGGTRYYCGVRAENSVGEDVNTAELSNICSGSEMIQRQTVTVVNV